MKNYNPIDILMLLVAILQLILSTYWEYRNRGGPKGRCRSKGDRKQGRKQGDEQDDTNKKGGEKDEQP